MPPSAQERRQMQAADHAADDEEGERDQHAAGAAAGGVERAGAAAVGELHADAEHEGADDERRPDRRDGAAEARHQRRDRHDRRARRWRSAAAPPSNPSASPRTRNRRHDGGEAELGLEERRAERKAERPAAPPTPAARRSAPARPARRVASTAASRNGQSSRGDARDRGRVDCVAQRSLVAAANSIRNAAQLRGWPLITTRAERLLQVVPLGARATRPDGCASAVQSTIEP